MDETEELKYQDELKSNRFSITFMGIMCVVCILVWLANEMGIFVVNKTYMRAGIALGCICLLVPIGIYLVTKGRERRFKYVIITAVSLSAITIETFLTFHGVLMCMIPILLAAQYSERKMFKVAYILNLFGILVAVIAGYYIGCWDGNMIYATTYGITLQNDSLAARAAVMDSGYMFQLIMYFSIPRMVVFTVYSYGIEFILKNAKVEYVKQNLMRMHAEHDALTGLENRRKYEQRVKEEYAKADSVYIAFIDVNFLKKINDMCGHEAGDSVLKRVAEDMKTLESDRIHAYRLGGDEFAFVLCGYSENKAEKLIEEWSRGVEPLNRREDPVHCSLAIGGAYGEPPIDMELLLKQADDNMYVKKKAMKAERAD